ncbi:MAG: hypothetical protein A2234_05630 [Elusimicrobia bacterium RIFOXYA2_FULL_58_8]|nr:MAG: hypothetical protein A2285_02965 [Elusimicrobia bacterium RIFOXYA12_FULL_57_11]OGS13788.1 MAG: hypothetical protein A2234_05630 [Elusimicrobia bacterium RIFOXYA2_FULL_58_8]
MYGHGGKIFLSSALAAVFASAAFAGFPMSGGDAAVRRNVVASGGAIASGTGLSLNCALAEAVVSTFSGAGFKFSSGLLSISAQPGTVISITSVSKATGTLELAWIAPGLDGFLGAVNGGYYRIDSSSEPAHVFDPTVFIAEFSTSVTPGDLQAYVLGGLQPNTTYYTRVYLADSRKMVAERSAPGDESTLANLPVSPAVSGVYSSSVSFVWSIPPGDAEGYALDASSTSFGSLFPGGLIYSSATDQGLQLTLTVTGLAPLTSYYFRLASLNWQQDVNFGTIMLVRTLEAPVPLPIEGLASLPNALARSVLFNWSNPVYADPMGVLVQMSTAPIIQTAANGTDYHDGDLMADGAVILSSAAAAEQVHTGLLLNSTYYYRFSSRNTAHAYSVFVSTECMLDLPPMSPGGLQASLNPARTEVALSWSGVVSNHDGSNFRFAGEPLELSRYDIYRATGVINPVWTFVASTAASSTGVVLPVSDPDIPCYYKVSALDSRGEVADSMVVDTGRNLYAVAPDMVSRIKIPSEMARVVTPGGNSAGNPLFFAARENAGDVGGKVLKSVEFIPFQAPSGVEVANFRLDTPDLDIILRYDAVNGQVVPSGFTASAASLSSFKPSIATEEAASSLGAFWFNGREYVKVFGKVDPESQTVTVRSAMPGKYQIRSLARSSGVNFDVSQMSTKVITPNNDTINDSVIFTLENPRASAFSGKIYDLKGAFVAEMLLGTALADTLEWNGRAGGSVVPRGVYVYQITAEGKTFTGTIVVIR